MVGKDVHLIVFIDYDGCFCFAIQLVYQGHMEQGAYKTVAVSQRMKHLHVILLMGPATVCLASLDSFAKIVSCIEYSKTCNKRHRLRIEKTYLRTNILDSLLKRGKPV